MIAVKSRVMSFLVVESGAGVTELVTTGDDVTSGVIGVDLFMVVVRVKGDDLVMGVLVLGVEGKVGNVPPTCKAKKKSNCDLHD